MNEGIIDDQCRQRQAETVVVGPGHGRREIAPVEKVILGTAHDRILFAGITQQLFEQDVIGQRRHFDLVDVRTQSFTVDPACLDIHLHQFMEVAVFGCLRAAIGYLALFVRTILVDRDRAVVSLGTAGFKYVDCLLTNTLLFRCQIHGCCSFSLVTIYS